MLTEKKNVGQPLTLRDDLLRDCRSVVEHFQRGCTFRDITDDQMDILVSLACNATKLHGKIERYRSTV